MIILLRPEGEFVKKMRVLVEECVRKLVWAAPPGGQGAATQPGVQHAETERHDRLRVLLSTASASAARMIVSDGNTQRRTSRPCRC